MVFGPDRHKIGRLNVSGERTPRSGPWLVPLGIRMEEGEFGEPVGVVVVW